jgi:hypothetical protein
VKTDSHMELLEKSILKSQLILKSAAKEMSLRFNSLPQKMKKAFLIGFGIVMGGISFMLIIQALSNQENKTTISIQKLTVPNNIYMKEQRSILNEHLIPVGKFKGEMDGEFEAFYLAVDSDGKTFINRSPDFSDDPYDKSKGWEQTSKDDLERFQKQLHFFPARVKGMKP